MIEWNFVNTYFMAAIVSSFVLIIIWFFLMRKWGEMESANLYLVIIAYVLAAIAGFLVIRSFLKK